MIGFFSAAGIALLLYLAAEAWLHGRRLARIPIRIHVNGTRGKTSVTRRLAAALRGAGVRTIGKVTGDEPRLLLPDGSERVIARRGPARIQEQMWLVRQAAAWRAEAIVVECMALAPELQRVSEERMIRSTLGVITNVRPDHGEVMGGELDAVAAALAGTIPRDGVLVTADRRYLPRFQEWAAAKGTRVVLAEAAGGEGGEPAPAEEHAAIVRAVGAELKLGVAAAETGTPAPGIWRLEQEGWRMHFVDAFSANDPVSTQLLQRMAAAAVPLPSPWVALLNNRADRPARMTGFAEALGAERAFTAVAVAGGLAGLARRRLRAAGCEAWVLAARRPGEALEEIARRVGRGDFTVVGMGNAKGLGRECARYLAERGSPCR